MREALDKLAREAVADFDKTKATWEHDVTFKITETQYGRSIKTSDRVWNTVDQGTRAHRISSHGDYPLRFTVGGKAKTRVRVIGSSGGSAGRDWVSASSVQHPGTKARQFTQVLATRWRKQMPSYFKKALKVAAGQT